MATRRPLLKRIAPFRRWMLACARTGNRLRAEWRVFRQARRDSLTGLQSRSMAETRLRMLNLGDVHALLIIDVKRFHEVNSCFGFECANRCLAEIADRLHAVLPHAAVLGRVQTDVFIAVSHRLDRRDESAALVRLVRQALAKPYCGETAIVLEFAIGVTLTGEQALDHREVMRRADIALHHAKQRPQTHITFFQQALSDAMLRKHSIDQRLRMAVAQEQIRPFLQPIVDVAHGTIIGFEILARWQDAELSVVTPDEFIPVAETNGLVGRIGEQLLFAACTAASAWPRRLMLSVNLSASQLADPLCALRLMAVLGRSGFPASRLHVEITETTKLESSIAAKENLHALRKAGARIMLDDFGAGYCSFTRLASHQIDGIKIDRSLTFTMTSQESANTIVLSIIALARDLGLEVVAEGVETIDQASALLRAGCSMAQGYHYGRPMPLDQVPAFLGGDVSAGARSDDSATTLAG